jgi:hypothetical protein
MEQHSPSVRAQAVALMRQGVPNRTVAERLNVPRGTVGWWRSEDRRARGETYEQPTDCPRCTGREFDQVAYAYLLGLYLGDGHIISKRKQHHLSVFCNAMQTGLISAAEDAMRKVMPLPSVKQRYKPGCVEVKSYTTSSPTSPKTSDGSTPTPSTHSASSGPTAPATATRTTSPSPAKPP